MLFLNASLFLLILFATLSSTYSPKAQPRTIFLGRPLAPLSSFSYPPASSRPKFRYWFPDASVPQAAVQADIAAIAGASAGGLEFLGYYNQGFPPISTDWSIYGFGTPAFKELLRAALKATADHGLVFDFAVGPNTAAGVPAIPRTEGLAMELVYGSKVLGNSASVGVIPAPVLSFNHQPLNGWVHEPENWGPSELIAVLAAQVTSRSRRTGSTEQVELDENSVIDLTTLARNGSIDWKAPATGGSGQGSPLPWVVMAFYQRYSNERSCVSVSQAPTWIGNGSWMVDHFSSAGAKKATDFWDKNLLNDKDVDALMRQVGMYSWEDSMEMMAPLWWTPDFLKRFEKSRGYSAVKYLPVFFQARNLWNGYGAPYDSSYMFKGQPADGGKYAEDYRLTLSEGYGDFLRHYQSWAAARGMDHSAQPAYNMPLDMSANIPLVGAPELESLGFGESIDVYRQFTGPAHLFGRNVISTEIGAQRGGAYAQTVPTLLSLFRDSFAAGVNTLVIHGFAYGGSYPGTTWPGYTPFQYEFCEMWGPRQPAWRHLNDTFLYAARNSEVLKTGVPKVDLAFYVWKHPWSARPVYLGAELTAAGYTHEYLGPENIASTAAPIRDGTLAPDGPGYKAIVLLGQTRISPAASAALLRFAEAGLPIFILGALPNITIGSIGQEEVSKNMARLVAGNFPKVRTMPSADFGPAMLFEHGILPRVTITSTDGAGNASQLFTTWRSDTDSGTEFVYILNRGPDSIFGMSFATSDIAVPYILDSWTGVQTPLVTYLRNNEEIVAWITLARGQSTILAFVTPNEPETNTPLHVISHSGNLAYLRVNADGHIEGLVNDASEASVLLSDNRQVTILPLESVVDPSALPTVTLGPWNLTVESYASPIALTTASPSDNRTRIKISPPLQTLAPWTRIRGIERVSGIGTYLTRFKVPSMVSNTDADIVYTLHFTGRVLNTIRVYVNGALVPAIDPSAPGDGRDISAMLERDKENEVIVEVASTLFNAVKSRMSDLRSVGMGVRVPKYYTDVPWAEFGLIGEVVVKTWRRVLIS